MSKKIILSGYFGFDNLGDEAILYSMIQGLGAMEGAEIVALSGNPEKTSEKFGIRTVDRMSFSQVLKEIRSCDLFVSGGGSLLQDVTSKRSLLYYLALLKVAKFFGKKVMIYSQGIGPVIDPKNRQKLAKVFKKLDEINVRDNESKQELKAMGVQNPVSVTADTVFLLDKPELESGRKILKKIGLEVPEKTDFEEKNKGKESQDENREPDTSREVLVGISIRPWKDLDEKIVTEIQETIWLTKQKYAQAKFVFLPFHHPGDLELSKKLYDLLEDKNNVYLLKEHLNEREMLSVIGNMDLMLSMRLHGLIFAVVAGAYPLGISYDPKIQSLLKELHMKEALDVENLDAKVLAMQLDETIQAMEERKEEIEDLAGLMQKRALENIEIVRRLLG